MEFTLCAKHCAGVWEDCAQQKQRGPQLPLRLQMVCRLHKNRDTGGYKLHTDLSSLSSPLFSFSLCSGHTVSLLAPNVSGILFSQSSSGQLSGLFKSSLRSRLFSETYSNQFKLLPIPETCHLHPLLDGMIVFQLIRV